MKHDADEQLVYCRQVNRLTLLLLFFLSTANMVIQIEKDLREVEKKFPEHEYWRVTPAATTKTTLAAGATYPTAVYPSYCQCEEISQRRCPLPVQQSSQGTIGRSQWRNQVCICYDEPVHNWVQ